MSVADPVVGILQPYFLPAPAYFDLIRRSDRWIVFDTSQFRRHGWMNRNRILHPKEGWQYIGLALAKHPRETSLTDIRLAHGVAWAQRLLGQLQHYRDAPYFLETIDMLEAGFSMEAHTLVDVDVQLLGAVCEALGISFAPERFSVLAPTLDLGPIEGPGDWALRICEAIGAGTYLNPPGGAHLFDRSAFEAAGVTLEIRQPSELRYPTPGHTFVPMLSVVDALMWMGRDGLSAFLQAQI